MSKAVEVEELCSLDSELNLNSYSALSSCMTWADFNMLLLPHQQQRSGGTWMAQSVKRPTLDLRVVSSRPTSDSALGMEPTFKKINNRGIINNTDHWVSQKSITRKEKKKKRKEKGGDHSRNLTGFSSSVCINSSAKSGQFLSNRKISGVLCLVFF